MRMEGSREYVPKSWRKRTIALRRYRYEANEHGSLKFGKVEGGVQQLACINFSAYVRSKFNIRLISKRETAE